MRLILILIIGHSCITFAEKVRVERLSTLEQIDAYYKSIRTAYPEELQRHPNVPAPNYYVTDVFQIPQKWGEKILAHVESAFQKKFFHELSHFDFFHGHPLTKGPQTQYDSIEDYLNDVVVMVYHSEEHTRRWRPGSPARSFLGWPNQAGVMPAVELQGIDTSRGNYDKGTIHSDQVVLALSGQIQRERMQNVSIKTSKDGKPCNFQNMIYFFKDPKGRFQTSFGDRIEIFSHCNYPR